MKVNAIIPWYMVLWKAPANVPIDGHCTSTPARASMYDGMVFQCNPVPCQSIL